MKTTPATPDTSPAPWAHLPEATQEAIELAIAEAFVAWIDREAAKLRPMNQSQKGNADGVLSAGVSTTTL